MGKPPMIYLHEYMTGRDFSDKTCLVAGPAICLVKDLYEVPEYDFLIGINQHTQILLPEMIVALDEHTREIIPHYRGLVLSKQKSADVNIGECPSFGHSGPSAVWVADYMKFKRIIVAGFDCYMHPVRSYWHNCTRITEPHTKTTWEQQKIIWDICFHTLKHPERIRVMSGPLTEIFGYWNPIEDRLNAEKGSDV